MFHWGYMSFYKFDSTWVYREVLILPIFVLILWFCWMKVVRNALKEEMANLATPREGTLSNPDSDYEIIDSESEGPSKRYMTDDGGEMSETDVVPKDKDL